MESFTYLPVCKKNSLCTFLFVFMEVFLGWASAAQPHKTIIVLSSVVVILSKKQPLASASCLQFNLAQSHGLKLFKKDSGLIRNLFSFLIFQTQEQKFEDLKLEKLSDKPITYILKKFNSKNFTSFHKSDFRVNL